MRSALVWRAQEKKARQSSKKVSARRSYAYADKKKKGNEKARRCIMHYRDVALVCLVKRPLHRFRRRCGQEQLPLAVTAPWSHDTSKLPLVPGGHWYVFASQWYKSDVTSGAAQ